MTNHFLVASTATLMLVGSLAAGAQDADDPAPEELETVHVIGEQPGPALWKIRKDDHVMWVLGTHGPLPQGVAWRPRQVEARVAESQQVLFPGGGGVSVDIGILRGLTMLPAALGAGKIPDGRTLEDVLPAATYAKWRALREKYIGKDDDVERWRPAIALEILSEKTRAVTTKTGGQRASAVVRSVAKAHKVKVLQLPYLNKTVHVDNPRSLLKTARQLGTPELECFTRAIDGLESARQAEAEMANAWARGDIRALRALHSGPREVSGQSQGSGCMLNLMDALTESDSSGGKRAKRMFDSMKWHSEQSEAQVKRNWIAAATKALSNNASTFAVLPMSEVIRPDGYLAALRDLGYEVEEPL